MKINKKTIINVAIYIGLMVGIGLIPASEPITQVGMRVIGILTATIFAWCAMDLIWPSFVALVLVGLSGYSTVSGLFATAMSNTSIMLMFFLLLFGGVIATSDVGNALAMRIVNLKVAKGRPWLLTILLLLAAFIPALVIGGIPATIIIWSIIYGIAREVGIAPKSPWVVMVLFLSAFMANNAMNVLPFQISVVIALALARAVDPSAAIPYLSWLTFMFIFILALMFVCVLVSRFVFKPDMEKLKNYETKTDIPPYTFEQKAGLWLMGALVFFLLVPTLLPAGNFFVDTLNKIGNVGTVALIIVVALLIRHDGKPCFTFKDIAYQGIIWQMIIMCAAGITISGALLTPDTGVSTALSNLVGGLGSSLSGVAFAYILIALCLLSTNVFANNVIGMISVTMLFTLGPTMNIEPMMYLPMMLFAANCGFMFPSSSTPAAMLYGNTEWIDQKSIIKYSIMLIVVLLVCFLVIGVPLVQILF